MGIQKAFKSQHKPRKKQGDKKALLLLPFPISLSELLKPPLVSLNICSFRLYNLWMFHHQILLTSLLEISYISPSLSSSTTITFTQAPFCTSCTPKPSESFTIWLLPSVLIPSPANFLSLKIHHWLSFCPFCRAASFHVNSFLCNSSTSRSLPMQYLIIIRSQFKCHTSGRAFLNCYYEVVMWSLANQFNFHGSYI